MFLRRFFEPGLAQASYLIGSKSAREAIVIDANRDIDQYLDAAKAEGARIAHVTETHIHADYVSGSRELAARAGAKLHLSREGGPDWQYAFAKADGAGLLGDGDRIEVGEIAIDVAHTPGHTPEHLSFLVTDRETASDPMGAVTGDFVFVGDVGRPDLLERAAKQAGTMRAGARTLFHSLQRFAERPDWLQIWPGHGAGSACGKGISAMPQSTLGYERRFNWAFRVQTEDEFVDRVLAGQPDPPTYFAEMKRVNRMGPPALGAFARPPLVPGDALPAAMDGGALVIDTRLANDFLLGHIPGSLSIPLDGSFATWAGWLVPYTQEFYLLVDERAPRRIDAAVRALAMIGLDRVAGYFEAAALETWTASGRSLGTVAQIDATDLQASLRHGAVSVLDVRNDSEWAGGHIAGAQHIPLGNLTGRIGEIDRRRPVVIHCAAGTRSAIAASLLRANGVDRVINLTGGLNTWIRAGLPVEQ